MNSKRSLLVVIFLLGFAVLSLAAAPPYYDRDQPARYLPITTGPDQVKGGSKTAGLHLTQGPEPALPPVFSAPWILVPQISSGGEMGVGPGVYPYESDSSGTLDVNGRIRIREGDPQPGRVLTTDDTSGLARWGDLSGSSPISCLSPYGAIHEITSSGFNCLDFVTTIQVGTASGLTLYQNSAPIGPGAPTSGPLELGVNLPATNSALEIEENNQLAFNNNCAAGSYWIYDDTNGWGCGSPPVVPGPTLYLKELSGNSPAACSSVTAGGVSWTEVAYLQEQTDGFKEAIDVNNVRICEPAATLDCQIFYLKSVYNSAAPGGISVTCPSGFVTPTGNSAYSYREYIYDGKYNMVRPCLRCN